MISKITEKMKIKDQLKNIKTGFKIYPATLILAVMTFLYLSYIDILRYKDISMLGMSFDYDNIQTLLVASIIIFFTVEQFLRMKEFDNKNKIIGSYILGFILSLLLYFLVINKEAARYETIYIGLILSLLITSISLVREKEDFSSYIISVISTIFTTILYTLVLTGSIFIILTTIEILFDLLLPDYIKPIIVYACIFLFGVSFFVSNLKSNYSLKKEKMGKVLSGLIDYIAVPMLIIYSLILYVYLGKIVITSNWPEGIVSHLVIWYQIVALVVLVLLQDSDKKLSKEFKEYFPKFSIPILIMMMISISIRINEYGITENRYFIFALGIYVIVNMMLYGFKKNFDLRYFSAILVAFILIALISPINAFNISKYSQNKRLEEILIKNNMLEDNLMVKNENLNKDEIREISNIINYFESKDELFDIKYIKQPIELNDMKEEYGFSYSPEIYRGFDDDKRYGELNQSATNIVDIKSYDEYLFLRSWEDKEIKSEGYVVALEEVLDQGMDRNQQYALSISSEDDGKINQVFRKDMKDIVVELISREDKKEEVLDDYKYSNNYNDAIYDYEDEKIKLKLIPKGINFEEDKNDKNYESLQVNSIQFDLFFKIK